MLDDYTRDLERNREEANALCESLFITITRFFREPARLCGVDERSVPRADC